MSVSVQSGLWLLGLITLLTLPEQGFPQCYRPNLRSPGFVQPPCCAQVSTAPVRETIASCFKQQETMYHGCNTHAFIFTTVNNKQYCVDPASTWLERRLKILASRGICCVIL